MKQLITKQTVLFFFIFLVAIFFFSFIAGSGYKTDALTGELVNLLDRVEQKELELTLLEAEVQLKDQILNQKDQVIGTKVEEIDEITEKIQEKEKAITQIKQQLNSQEGRYMACEERVVHKTIEVERLVDEVDTCEKTNEDVIVVLSEYVRAICCSYSETHQDYKTIRWGINNGEISCEEGPFSVDCKTGKTIII